MQEYNRIEDTEYISDAPSQLNKNMESIATDFSGASFPTENLFVGMKCLRTDENKIYRLYENASNQLVWQHEYTIVDGGIKVKQADDASSATKATNDANNKAITSYVAKLESDANNTFIINFYDGNNDKLGSVTIPETKIETMTGASASSAGKAGLVPAPTAGAKNRYLNAYGKFEEISVPVTSVNGKTGDVVVDTLPVGTSIIYMGDTVPDGYLAENGAAISRTTYAKLFAVIGTKYGAGNSSTTFNLPNKNNGSFAEGSDTAGTVKSAGLPNITGSIIDQRRAKSNYLATGAFSAVYEHINTSNASTWVAEQFGGWTTTLNASRSSSIYGNSNTVQPKSVTVKFCIKY